MVIKESELNKSDSAFKIEKRTFVHSYDGKFRSDLKESHKCTASTKVMDEHARKLNAK